MPDVLELCREAFGKVPAAWLVKLETWGEAYTAEELVTAFQETKDGKGRNIGYTETILKRLKGERAAATRQPLGKSDRLLCDCCETPTYVDNMATRTIFGVLYGVCPPCVQEIDEACRNQPTERRGIALGSAGLVEAYWEGVTA